MASLFPTLAVLWEDRYAARQHPWLLFFYISKYLTPFLHTDVRLIEDVNSDDPQALASIVTELRRVTTITITQISVMIVGKGDEEITNLIEGEELGDGSSENQVWHPVLVLSLPPWHMKTIGARLAYCLVGPLTYALLAASFAGYFSNGIKSVTVFFFGIFHIAGPMAIWTYEVRHNPYVFAEEMRGNTTAAEEAALLQANRNFAWWYFEQGFRGELERRPRNGFRE